AEPTHGPVLNRASMVIDAAADGQGVALARTTLAAWDLINGRLVRPFDLVLRLSKNYWVVCPKAASGLPKITTFRAWLLAEAAEDARRLKTLTRKPQRVHAQSDAAPAEWEATVSYTNPQDQTFQGVPASVNTNGGAD